MPDNDKSKDGKSNFLDKINEFEDDLNREECELVLKVQTTRDKYETFLWKSITSFGRPYFWLVLALFFALFQIFHVSLVLLSAGASYLFSVAWIKRLFHRKRPHHICKELKPLKSHIKEHSFPSGHTFYASVSALSLSLCYGGIIFLVPAIIFSLLVGYSRIYIGVHYLSDVLISLFLAIVFALIIFINFPFFMDLNILLKSILQY